MVQQQLREKLEELEASDTEALKARWRELYGADPPKGLSAKLMRRAIGFELQVRAHGPCKPAIRKELRKALSGSASVEAKLANQIAPGSRLIREWHGDVHVVDVVEDGVTWNQKSYASLSAVAREITGTRWNGRKFFGVTTQVGAS